MATRAERLAELQTELAEIKSALTKARVAVSANTGGVSVQRSYQMLLQERKEIERRIALLDGTKPTFGNIDMSGALG